MVEFKYWFHGDKSVPFCVSTVIGHDTYNYWEKITCELFLWAVYLERFSIFSLSSILIAV